MSDVESDIFDRCRKIFLCPAARHACWYRPLHHHDRSIRQPKQRSSSRYLGKFKSSKHLGYCRKTNKVTSRMFLNLDVDIKVKSCFLSPRNEGISGVEVNLPLLLTLALNTSEGSTLRSACITSEKGPKSAFNMKLGGCQTRSRHLGEEKICFQMNQPTRCSNFSGLLLVV